MAPDSWCFLWRRLAKQHLGRKCQPVAALFDSAVDFVSELVAGEFVFDQVPQAVAQLFDEGAFHVADSRQVEVIELEACIGDVRVDGDAGKDDLPTAGSMAICVSSQRRTVVSPSASSEMICRPLS